jgi:hypothetical protein
MGSKSRPKFGKRGSSPTANSTTTFFLGLKVAPGIWSRKSSCPIGKFGLETFWVPRPSRQPDRQRIERGRPTRPGRRPVRYRARANRTDACLPITRRLARHVGVQRERCSDRERSHTRHHRITAGCWCRGFRARDPRSQLYQQHRSDFRSRARAADDCYTITGMGTSILSACRDRWQPA